MNRRCAWPCANVQSFSCRRRLRRRRSRCCSSSSSAPSCCWKPRPAMPSTPISPATAAATPALIAAAARGMGARPVGRCRGFAAYLWALARLDLGWSVTFARPVLDVVLERLPNTLLLMGSATALSFGLGSALGIVAGARPGSSARPAAVDRLARALCRAGLLARPCADRRLRRRAALAAARRHRDASPPARRASPARSTSPGIWSCRSRRSASSIWRSICA